MSKTNRCNYLIYSVIINSVANTRNEVITMIMDNNSHSVFSLNYHLVFVVKYRRQVINNDVSNRLKDIYNYISPKYNITLLEWNHDKDHIHILFKAHPNSELSKFTNAYKSASSRLIKKEFPNIKNK